MTAGAHAGIGPALRAAILGVGLAGALHGAAWAEEAGGAPRGAPADRFDTVVVDAGHGGDDHGAAGPDGILEKQVVLEVARAVAARLQQAGVHVLLTRDRDVAVALQERTRMANDAGADLFVSIHANAAPSRLARGMETYFLSLDASDETSRSVAARENEAFGAAVPPVSAGADTVSAILGDLTDTEQLADSDEFARLTHARLAAIDPVPSRGVKQAPFMVLMGTRMPAALIEIGFLTNPKEGRSLADTGRQEEIAGAIADAVLEFGRRYDARRGQPPAPARAEPAPAQGGAVAEGGS